MVERKRCPKCGSAPVVVRSVEHHNGVELPDMFWAECEAFGCGVRGPQAFGFHGALVAFDEMLAGEEVTDEQAT